MADAPRDDDSDALAQGQALAAALGAMAWETDGDPVVAAVEVVEVPPPPPPAKPATPLLPAASPVAEAALDPERIVEAMLFVGGPPLNPDAVAGAVRGLTADRVRAALDALNARYARQRRPYAVTAQGGGYVLAVRPAFLGLRERLHGGPKEARLSQPALDVLSLVAYRQPVTRAEIDALRGADSAGVLRQLARLDLITAARRGEAEYTTTPRFLDLFKLASLDDLPKLGE